MKIRKVIVLIFCLYSLFFLFGSTLAPILAYLKCYELSAKLTSTYMFSCHQQPDRSFWLFGYPVALCCRCYGFYLGVTLTGFAALFDRIKINLKLFACFLIFCLVDIITNVAFGHRFNTGNTIRFIAGILMGILFITGLNYILKLRRRHKNEN